MQQQFTRPKFNWLALFVAVAGLFTLAAELIFRLSSLTYNRLSWSEILASQQSHSWHNIAANPLGGPLLVLERISSYVSHTNIFWLRLPSLIVAVIAVVFFYYVTR